MRKYETPEQLITHQVIRMESLNGMPLDGTSLSTLAQVLMDTLLLCKWQQNELRKMGCKTDAAGQVDPHGVDYATREVRIDPSDGNAYVLRKLTRHADNWMVEISDIMDGHQTIVSLVNDWLRWEHA